MNKRGFELTINFLVVIIISVVVLGLGIKFISDMVGNTREMIPMIDAKIHDELSRMVSGNKRVAIAFNEATIKKGESVGFGLGIMNTNPNKERFKVFAWCAKYGEFGTDSLNLGCPGTIGNKLGIVYDKGEFDIENNGDSQTMILVKAPKSAKAGNYVIYVNACSQGFSGVSCDESSIVTKYDSTQKIFVTVT